MQKLFTLIVMGIIFSVSPYFTNAQIQPPGLGAAACYAILSGNGAVTNTGTTYVTGDVGTNMTTTTGFDPTKVIGTIHPVPDGSTNRATIDMIAAYTYLDLLPFHVLLPDPTAFGNDLKLNPGTYRLGAATTLTGNLYLDAQNNSDAVFVFQINGALTTGALPKVILLNGAQSKNIYWRIAGAASLGNTAVFHGTIISNNGAINIAAGDSLYGRAFTTNGAIGVTEGTVISPEVTCLPFNTNCTEYRSKLGGLWSESNNWEENATGNWLMALTPPPVGSLVRIRHDIMQDVNFSITNCALILDNNGVSKLTIAPNITLSFGGGIDGNAYFNSQSVVVKSTAAGTGAISAMTPTSRTYVDNKVTVERYIPGTKRRWNLLTFGVISNTSTILQAWGGVNSNGTPRKRIEMSANRALYSPPLPYGTPPKSELLLSGVDADKKPNNFPVNANDLQEPADYVAGDGTIITGHRFANAANANANGYDWWPELNIPKGATWWETPTKSIISSALATTPSSIRPFIPGDTSDFGPERGTDWVSNALINTGYGGNGLINMNLSNAFNQHQAFMLYTRGDRRVLDNWYNATTLRPTGQLMSFERNVSIAPNPTGANLTVVGNPYPASVDFDTLYKANSNVIEPFFYTWDSRLPGNTGNGAWRTVFRVSPGMWHSTITAADPDKDNADIINGKPQLVSSSQGVMVVGTNAGGNLTFKESMKANIGEVAILPFEAGEQNGNSVGLLFTNLNIRSATNGTLNTIDGVAIVMDKEFNTTLNDNNDIRKVNSFTGEMGLSLKRNEEILMVEACPPPIEEAVFYLETKGLAPRGYALTFNENNLYADGREIYLKDKFLNTLTPISSNSKSVYNFDVTSETASAKPDRFEIVFKQSTVLPVSFTEITAYELRSNVKVNWTVATEGNMSHYEVEHSGNGIDFAKAVKVNAKNESPASYEWLNVQPGAGDHFYRVKAINLEGRNVTTRVVKVNIGNNGKSEFKVFPTIVNHTRNVTVQLTAMDKGNYSLQVTDMIGRVVSSQMIEHAGGSASLIVNLPTTISKGKYHVRLLGKSGDFVESVLQN